MQVCFGQVVPKRFGMCAEPPTVRACLGVEVFAVHKFADAASSPDNSPTISGQF